MSPDIGGFKYKRSHDRLTLPCKMEAEYPQKSRAETKSEWVNITSGCKDLYFLYILYIYIYTEPPAMGSSQKSLDIFRRTKPEQL